MRPQTDEQQRDIALIRGIAEIRVDARPQFVRVPEATDAAYALQSDDVAATAVGLHEDELQVEDVGVRILPQPAEPHSAAATFDLVQVRGGEEIVREPWSVLMRFFFLPEILAELVVRNPMGIVILFLQGDRIVTSAKGR